MSLFSSFFEKSSQKVWQIEKYSVPLHPQISKSAVLIVKI
jgi:hypothetical protein